MKPAKVIYNVKPLLKTESTNGERSTEMRINHVVVVITRHGNYGDENRTFREIAIHYRPEYPQLRSRIPYSCASTHTAVDSDAIKHIAEK